MSFVGTFIEYQERFEILPVRGHCIRAQVPLVLTEIQKLLAVCFINHEIAPQLGKPGRVGDLEKCTSLIRSVSQTRLG